MSVLRRVGWGSLDDHARHSWVDGLRPPEPGTDVSRILAAVRDGGDRVLRELTARHDGVTLPDPWVSREEWDAASVEPHLEMALNRAAASIGRYHAEQRNALRQERRVRTAPGVTAWRRWQPISRAGGYVPGGRAAYASSVLMLAIPAQLAGVDELIIATPPGADGTIAASVLVAARIGGVDRILKAGGAQAIAALAYGTETVPAVDKIFGAGNAWVTAAKRAVSTRVAIDLPAGPSECIVLADRTADAELVALDLLAQSEHGPDSVAIVVSDDGRLLAAVDAALPRLAADLATGGRALETLRRHGASVQVADMRTGIEVVNAVAAEHVSLQCDGADALAATVRNAGAVFIGPWSPIAAGDYATGTNHVLPTGASARAWSGVGVESFGRWIEVQRLSPSGVRGISPTVQAIAAAEGLPAHAASVRARAERAFDAAEADDATDLFRRPEPVIPYPAEPSDEELAARSGVAVTSVVRADMNTLGGGPLPAVAGALDGFDARRSTEYGDLAYVRLRAALGERLGVDPRRIVPGAGADELIRLVTTQALGAGDAVVIPTPTFAMFAVEARLAGARVVDMPRSVPACRQSVAEIRDLAEREAARLVWICTPNNPTGDAYPLDEIRALAAGLPALVCVDEVYLEFGEDSIGAAPGSTSANQLQDELANVLVLRSLSKSHGMAGARVGYLLVPDQLAERFDGVRLPLSVAAPSEAIALAALADEAGARDRRRAVIAARDRLSSLLSETGCEVLLSVTNSVAFRPPIEAAAVDAALLSRGVAVRRFETGPMAGWLRATARLEPEEGRLLRALKEVLT
ncbi:MAG: histidinol dehydrogenase [Chloroflexota bacterium]|nr:histidinol dehydrogenase [Chloroflexota bacterium]